MMNPLFLVCLVITGLSVFRGWRRGVIGLIFGVAAWLFILVFVIIARPLLYDALFQNDGFQDAIYHKVYPYADSAVPKLEANYLNNSGKSLSDAVRDVQNGGLTLPEKYQDMVDELKESGIDLGAVADTIEEGAVDSVEDIRESVVSTAAEKVTDYILQAISVIAAYLIAKILCLIAKLILDTVTEAGPIRPVTHAVGAAIGAGEACLYIWILLYAISLIRLSPQGAALYEQVEANPFILFLYDNNALRGLLEGLLQG